MWILHKNFWIHYAISIFKQTWFKHVCRLVHLLLRIPPLPLAGTRWAWEQYLWNHSLEYWSAFLLSSWDEVMHLQVPVYHMEALLFSKIYGPPLGSTLHSIWEKFNKKIVAWINAPLFSVWPQSSPHKKCSVVLTFYILRCNNVAVIECIIILWMKD